MRTKLCATCVTKHPVWGLIRCGGELTIAQCRGVRWRWHIWRCPWGSCPLCRECAVWSACLCTSWPDQNQWWTAVERREGGEGEGEGRRRGVRKRIERGERERGGEKIGRRWRKDKGNVIFDRNTIPWRQGPNHILLHSTHSSKRLYIPQT